MSQTMMLVPKRQRASFRERVSRALDAVRSYTISNLLSSDAKTAQILGFGAKTDAGIVVTARNAFTFSAVFDAVNQGSSDLAKLPLNLLKKIEGGGSEHYTASRTYRLLKDEPNPEMSAMDFRQTLQAHAMTRIGGFAEIERDGAGRPFWLWPITPDRVERKRDGNGPLYYLVDGKDSISARDMIDIRGLGYDGNCAYDVIDKARQAIGLALAAEKFGASFFGSGAGFPGLLGIKNAVGPDSMESFRKYVDQQYGPGSWNRFLILDNDPSFTPFGVEPQKAQMNELRTKQVEEVARFFNFPVHKLKNLDRATNNNIEQQDLEYYKGFMLNWTTKWEQECNRKLISPLESRQQFIKHNVNAFLRGDMAARAAFYEAMLDRGVFCADDVLELEDRNPQPNGLGKTFLVNSTMVPKDKLEEIVAARTKPAAPPTPDGDNSDDGVTQDDVDAADARAAEAERVSSEMRTRSEEAARRVAELEGAAGPTADALAEARARAAAETQRANTAETLAVEIRRVADTVQQQFQDAETERARLAAAIEVSAEHLRRETERATAATADAESARARASEVATRITEIEGREARRVTAIEMELVEARTRAEQAQQDVADAAVRLAALEAQRSTEADASADAIAESERRIADLERQVGDAQGAITPIEAHVQALTADLESERTSIASLRREHESTVAGQLEIINLRDGELTTMRARLAAHEERVATVERELASARSARQGRVSAEIAAHRGLIVDIMRRMVERETDRARRHQATPEKLRHWLDTFYRGHEDLMRTALLPAVRIHLAWIGSGDDPAGFAGALASRHVEESQRQILVLLDGDADDMAGSLPALLHRWDTERVSQIADDLMQRELDHVRER